MKSNRPVIIRLHEEGRSISEIAQALKLVKSTVSRTIKRYKELGNFNDRHRSGRPRTATTANNRRKVKTRIERNPRRSARKIAKDIGVPRESVRRMIKNDLQLKPYKLQEAHLLTEAMMATRLQRCKALKRRFAAGRHRSILFSDEKIFTIEQFHNHQNDRIWSSKAPLKEKIVGRSQKPKSIMVWAGVTYNGKTPLVFIDEGVKVNQELYLTQILQQKLVPWTAEHFGDQKFTFQQDSAPAHKARNVQDWCKGNFPDFITSQQWPPYSPDLNPMDFSIWGILEAKACAKPHKSLEALRRSLNAAWETLPLETVCKAVDQFPKRLKSCINVQGGYIEKV